MGKLDDKIKDVGGEIWRRFNWDLIGGILLFHFAQESFIFKLFVLGNIGILLYSILIIKDPKTLLVFLISKCFRDSND